MKKFIMGFIVVCLSICTLAFVGCGGNSSKSEEEQFNEAKQQFDNYTAEMKGSYFSYGESSEFSVNLLWDNDKLKIEVKDDSESYVNYYKENNGKVYYYENESAEWIETEFNTLKEFMKGSADNQAMVFLNILPSFTYSDFKTEEEFFVATEQMLNFYNATLQVPFESIKLKMKDSKFISASITSKYNDSKENWEFIFKDYASTKVTLPA